MQVEYLPLSICLIRWANCLFSIVLLNRMPSLVTCNKYSWAIPFSNYHCCEKTVSGRLFFLIVRRVSLFRLHIWYLRKIFQWKLYAKCRYAFNNNHSVLSNGKWSIRRSHPEVFLRKGILKICSKFTGEHPCCSMISIKQL